MLNRRLFMASAAAATAVPALGLRNAEAQAFPNRPITFVCPWGAGGGTDATARIYATLMEKELGQPVNVVNRTGGNGVVGHSAFATAAADGYTIGMITVEIGMMKWAGISDLTYEAYTPLALVNEDPPGVTVGEGAKWKNIKELADDIKANPGKYKASGTSQGGIWHLALAGWLQKMGLKADAVPWVPSNGAAPAMQDLAAGGIDIVTCSLPEARAMIDAKKARPLAVMATQRNPTFKDVPTLKEGLGVEWNIGAWRGIGAPKGLPKNVSDRLEAVIKKIHDSKEFREFMDGRGFGVVWADAAGFRKHMADDLAKMGDVMKAVGIAKT
ncbi:MAG: tripartite tricarboxylate transporter substrate binding protein [Alphaproteobacteria bacterium]|nr:tripartite tricarboxylate transporter substrate binding protein [Alphaproteobacteria bacterium]